jgi:hypothetical protein
VAQDAADGAAEFAQFSCEVGVVVLEQSRLFPLLLLEHVLDLLLCGLVRLLLWLTPLCPFGLLFGILELLALALQFLLLLGLNVDARML